MCGHDTLPCFIACIGNEIFWRTRCAETPKTEFLRFPCTETPVVEFLRFPSRAQRYSTVYYRERGYLAHPVRRNSKNGVSEVPMRRNSGSGVFEIPVRSDTPPYLIENEVFWRTPCAETPKTEFLRIPCAINPLLDDMWRGRRWSTSGTCIYMQIDEIGSISAPILEKNFMFIPVFALNKGSSLYQEADFVTHSRHVPG